jgi:hypothetical protein
MNKQKNKGYSKESLKNIIKQHRKNMITDPTVQDGGGGTPNLYGGA